jgi:uncharacterized RDD family membrane protein YckC
MKSVRYAGFWIRLIAYIIDAVILGAILILFMAVVGGPLILLKVSNVLIVLILAVPLLVLAFGYHPYFLASRGATPGKSILGLVVVDNTNRYPITWGKALIREIIGVRIVDKLTLSLGDLLIIIDSKKQALHDKIAGTYVIYRESISADVVEHQEEYK